MIVADTTTAAALLLPDHGLHRLARSARKNDRVWRFPPFWRVELQSVLLKYIRAGALAWEDFHLAARRADALFPKSECDVEAPIKEVQRLLREHERLSVYDAQFLALAHAKDTSLVTADAKLARHLDDSRIVSLTSFAA